MGTRVQLTRSGGLAGISMVATVDLDELPEATAERVRAALAEIDFDPPRTRGRTRGRGAPGPGAPDAYQYDLVVTGDKRRSLTTHDPHLTPELRAVLDALLPFAKPE